MSIHVTDLFKKLDKKNPPSLILFAPGEAPYGKANFEPWLAEEGVKQLLELYVPEDVRDLALTSYYAGEVSPGEVAAEVQTLPFLVDRKVVLVRQAENFFTLSSDKKGPLTPLMNCIEDLPDCTLLIMVSSDGNKARRLRKLCAAKGLVVACPQMNDREYGRWIQEQLKQRGYTIRPAALTLMIERVGDAMSDMVNAINLISSFAQDTTQLTEEHVNAACADVAETTIWALTDAIAASDTASALEALHELLALNRSHEEILGMINWLLENAYKAHPETKVTLGKPFIEKKVRPLASKWDMIKMQDALRLCTKTNFYFRDTGTDKTLLLETMIIKLAASRARPARVRGR